MASEIAESTAEKRTLVGSQCPLTVAYLFCVKVPYLLGHDSPSRWLPGENILHLRLLIGEHCGL